MKHSISVRSIQIANDKMISSKILLEFKSDFFLETTSDMFVHRIINEIEDTIRTNFIAMQL